MVIILSFKNKPEKMVPNIGIKKLKNDKNPTELYLISMFHREKATEVINIIYIIIKNQEIELIQMPFFH